MANVPGHGIRPLITAEELGEILHRAPSTILSDLRRAPHRVPPPCTPPGTRRPLWRPEAVEVWLQEASTQLPRRRPKKKRGAAADRTSQIAVEVAAKLLAPATPCLPRRREAGWSAADLRFQALLEEQTGELGASGRGLGGQPCPPPGEPAQPGPEASA